LIKREIKIPGKIGFGFRLPGGGKSCRA